MEFLEHSEFLDAITPMGVRLSTDAGLTRFTLTDDDGAGLSPRAVVFAPEPPHAPPGPVVATPTHALPGVIDAIIHKEHLGEVALCPARRWGPIVDLVAFDLAGDERWNDIDAEVALHLNDRDPLLLGTGDHRLVKRFAGAVLETGSPGEHDLSIVAMGAPIVMNLEQIGRLVVWCGNPAIADVVARLAKPATP